LSAPDFVRLAAQLATILLVAVLSGQALRALRQPSVLGEMLGGVILGPTLLGAVLPGVFAWLFSSSDIANAARESFTRLGMLFFLFVAGLQTDLTSLRRSARQAVSVGLAGTLVPVVAGIALVQALPLEFWGSRAAAAPAAFALFVGLNLANSALPVLARTLLDLGLMESRIGTTCMAAAVVDDLVTWACFALVLSHLVGAAPGVAPVSAPLALVALILLVATSRWLGPRALRWVRGRLAWPAGFISVTAVLLLAAASVSEAFGMHAFLCAFLLGVSLSGSDREHQEARNVIAHFAMGFFAPLYFVSLGLTTNFVGSFDGALVAVVLLAAVGSKLAGVLVGARLAGLPVDREVWAIGFGLNARGATGIILAAVGREAGVIDERVFVALATMAFVTSLMAGPAMRALLSGRPRPRDPAAA
jgi:Kef-type K+ transport system membrane component KefB